MTVVVLIHTVNYTITGKIPFLMGDLLTQYKHSFLSKTYKTLKMKYRSNTCTLSFGDLT